MCVCVCVTHVYMHTRASDPLQECVQEHAQEWQKWREGVSWLESLFKVNPLEQDQRGRAEEEAEGASASSWPSIHMFIGRHLCLFSPFSPLASAYHIAGNLFPTILFFQSLTLLSSSPS